MNQAIDYTAHPGVMFHPQSFQSLQQPPSSSYQMQPHQIPSIHFSSVPTIQQQQIQRQQIQNTIRHTTMESTQISPAPSPVPSTGSNLGSVAPSATAPLTSTSGSGPAPLQKKRSSKPRAPRQTKKQKLEDGTEKLPMQRSTSSRGRGGQGNTQSSGQQDSSQSNLYTQQPRIVCIVPGTDTMKLGFSDSTKPFLVRQVVAYRVNLPPATTAPTLVADGDAVMQDVSGVSASRPSSPSAFPTAIASTNELSELDALTAAVEQDESILNNKDTELLAKWRRKREIDLAGMERMLGETKSKKRGSSGTGSELSGKLSVPVQGSIEDMNIATVQMVERPLPAQQPQSIATTQSLVPPARIMHASALLGEEFPSVSSPPTATQSYTFGPRTPLSRGTWRVNSNPQSIRRCAETQEDILRNALEVHLGLRSKEQIGVCSVSLVIPDTWHSREITEYIDLLLVRIGFNSVFLMRESTASAFGAGLAAQACIVDLGATKTTVVCMEDGLLNPRSQFILNWGQQDLEDVFKLAIPSKSFWSQNEKLLKDAEALGPNQENMIVLRMRQQIRQWKEQYCYCMKNPEGITPPPQPYAPILTYHAATVRPIPKTIPAELAQAAVVATTAMFHPALFPSALRTGEQKDRLKLLDQENRRKDANWEAVSRSQYPIPIQSTSSDYRSDPQSLLDDDLSLHGCGKGGSCASSFPAIGSAAAKRRDRASSKQMIAERDSDDQHMSSQAATQELSQQSSDVSGGSFYLNPHSGSTSFPPAASSSYTSPVEEFLSHRLSLQHAILYSIRAASSSPVGSSGISSPIELQSKLAVSIILTGGGCHLPQLVEALEERLYDGIATILPGVTNVSCIIHPKGLDSTHLSWRGATILAQSQTTKDMWMSADEWRLHGYSVLREKAPFLIA